MARAEQMPRVEINIVPLVDVALVLLIIFMVTATFIKTGGMQLTLPASSISGIAREARRELVIGIAADGRFLWNGESVSDDELAAALGEDAAAHGRGTRVTLRGDTRAPHGRVVRAMTLAQESGFSRLVIATRREPAGRGHEH